MDERIIWDKTVIKCCLCNIEFDWYGIKTASKVHVGKKSHQRALKSESLREKRARSISVRGVRFKQEYRKTVRDYFEEYAAVESIFRYALEGTKDDYILIVRFFSPETVYKFLNIQSSWVINGQFAHIEADTYSGLHDGNGYGSSGIQYDDDISHSGLLPPPPHVHQNEWANVEKQYPKYSSTNEGTYSNNRASSNMNMHSLNDSEYKLRDVDLGDQFKAPRKNIGHKDSYNEYERSISHAETGPSCMAAFSMDRRDVPYFDRSQNVDKKQVISGSYSSRNIPTTSSNYGRTSKYAEPDVDFKHSYDREESYQNPHRTIQPSINSKEIYSEKGDRYLDSSKSAIDREANKADYWESNRSGAHQRTVGTNMYQDSVKTRVHRESTKADMHQEANRSGGYREADRDDIYPETKRSGVYHDTTRVDTYKESNRSGSLRETDRGALYPESKRSVMHREITIVNNLHEDLYRSGGHRETNRGDYPERKKSGVNREAVRGDMYLEPDRSGVHQKADRGDIYPDKKRSSDIAGGSKARVSGERYKDRNSTDAFKDRDGYGDFRSGNENDRYKDRINDSKEMARIRDRGDEHNCRDRALNKNSSRSDRSRSPINRHLKVHQDQGKIESVSEHKRTLPKIRNSQLKGSFDVQIQELCTEINAGVCLSSKVNNACCDVRDSLCALYRGSDVKPFGSLNLGIGIKGGFLEICIFFPDSIKLKLLQKKLLCADYLGVVRDAFKQSPLFKNVSLSPDNTLSFTHMPSKYNIKASVLRDALVLDDKLFEMYLSSDRRLKPIFVFINFWAHCHNIFEELMFDEHEMNLLIIFYLQRLSKPIVPPAHMLIVDNEAMNIDNKCLSYWHTNFIKDIRALPKNENDSDLLTLIEGFYLFYSDFSFKGVVVSPFAGLAIPSGLFKDNLDLPREFKKYNYLVKNKHVYPLNTESPICIQDPIKLNRNATIATSSKKLAHFREKCLAASGIMYKFRVKHTENGLVSALLNLTDNTKDHTQKMISKISTRYSERLNEDDTILLFKRLNIMMQTVLDRIANAKFSINEVVHYSNYGRIRDLLDPNVVYSCKQFHNLWSSRKTYKKDIPHNSSILEWEAALSAKIMDSLYRGVRFNTPLFEYEVRGYIRRNEKVIQIDLVFKDVDDDSINSIVSFLSPIIEYELKRISIV